MTIHKSKRTCQKRGVARSILYLVGLYGRELRKGELEHGGRELRKGELEHGGVAWWRRYGRTSEESKNKTMGGVRQK